jgi:hypothetical protein
VTWSAPWNGGSTITSYTITFLESDGVTYSELTAYCDGSLGSIVTSRTCTIPSDSFYNAPYSHAWGSSIYAKITATNVKGTSGLSLAGNGGILMRSPDAPINLANVAENTSGTTIGLSWDEGLINGGSAVLDYQVSYALLGDSVFTILDTGITVKSYISTGLTPG